MDIIPIPGFSEPVSSLTHLITAGIAFFASYFLHIKGSGNKTRFFSLAVFTFSLIFLFSMSGVYHLLMPGGLPRDVFQRLDHAAIWILIAGTFTPIHTLLFRGAWRWGFLSIIWSVAISGLVLEVVFFKSIPEWLSLCFYLSLGWMGIISGWKCAKDYGFNKAKNLVFGGIAYSIGALLEFSRWPILIEGVVGPHEVFHIFVILGAGYHWIFIFQRAGYPIISRIIVDVIERPNSQFFAKTQGEKLIVNAQSLDSLKDKLSIEIKNHFPKSVRPNSVILKLSKEDIINLDET